MNATQITLEGWRQALDRLDVPARIEVIETALSRPIEGEGVRKMLRREYLEITDDRHDSKA